MTTPTAAESVWKTLLSIGAIPMGSKAWERLGVLQGRPAPGAELTNDYNVLEAGLWNFISVNKGCYKGQETISWLITYDGVKQTLCGIRLSSPVEPGSAITVNEKKYTPAIDIWSIGCIFAELVTGKPLFPGKNVVHQLDLMTDILGVPSPEAIARLKLISLMTVKQEKLNSKETS